MPPNEKTPLPSPSPSNPLLAEFREAREEVSRVASAVTVGVTYMGRAVRIFESEHNLDARARLAGEKAVDNMMKAATRIERAAQRVERAFEQSTTIVRDVPMAVEPETSEKRRGDITGVFALGKRIPSNWVVRGAAFLMVATFVLGLVLGKYTGVQPKAVIKYASPALGVP